MNGNNLRKNRAGFTLMEILVALGIFTILVTAIVSVFLLSLQAQRQTSFRQKTLASIRFATETIARQIRTSEIAYEAYGGAIPSAPVSNLVLIDQAGREIEYSLSSLGIDLTIITDKGTPQEVIEQALLTSSEEVTVLDLNFYIDPITSPYTEEKCNVDSGPTGCSPASVSEGGCTVNDPTDDFLPGFCRCNINTDCSTTSYCKYDESIDGSLCLPFDNQPRITMILGFQSKGVKPQDLKTIYLQTTVSGRVYKR